MREAMLADWYQEVLAEEEEEARAAEAQGSHQ